MTEVGGGGGAGGSWEVGKTNDEDDARMRIFGDENDDAL